MLPCRTMWENIVWLMIYQKRSPPNAVSNSFTLQKHPRWWSHPVYPWKTLVERGGSLCRNISGGGHVHCIHEGPWLREMQRCGRHCGCPLLLLQLSSVTQSCPTLCDPMNRSMPGLPVLHQIPEFTQTHLHRVRDAIQPSHPQSSPSPPAPNPSQHQSLFQWVNSSHEVAKVLEFQL